MNDNDIFLIKRTTYACLIISWILFLAPLPYTSTIGITLTLNAIILSVICICKINVKHGLITLVIGTVISSICYSIGLFLDMAILEKKIENSDFKYKSPFSNTQNRNNFK